VKFVAVSFSMNGVEMGAENLGGAYSVIFRENMTADLVLGDAPINSVPYTVENGGDRVTVRYGGDDYVFEYKDGAYIFDFAGAMVLRFEKEAE
jgi:hypothetical protein